MRVVIQRVSSASVSIRQNVHSSIGPGLLVLVGIEDLDDKADADWLAGKVCNLRIFDDENKVPNISVLETKGEILLVSQFTLHASTKKGNRPSYIRASGPQHAIPMYEYFIEQLEKTLGMPVKTGVFGEDMQVSLINDGPITIWIDSKNRE